jgi:two-component system response regulator FixJ
MQLRDVVAVVDDDEINREIVRRTLESVFIEVRTYASARAFLDDPQHRQVDGLILDVRMPVMSGMELQRILLDSGWHAPIIFLTGHGDVPMAVEAMRRGAAGFLQKPCQEQELIDQVQRALENGRRDGERERRRDTVRARFELLTSREREVLELLGHGQRTKDIAQALSISVKTVEEHRMNLMRKTRTGTTLELVRAAVQAEMLSEQTDRTPRS